MSNIKISELDQAGALTGIELIPIVQDNLTLRTTANQIKAFAGIAISNNIIADATSTTMAPSVNAVKTYADGLVVGLLDDRGNYTPWVTSPGNYPSSGGSGVGGAIQKGDIWFINGNGYLGTIPVVIGVSVRALIDNPSPTNSANWDVLDASLIQPTLQSVLNTGYEAFNTQIYLKSSALDYYTRLNTNSLYIWDMNSEGNYKAKQCRIYNSGTSNYIDLSVLGSAPILTVYHSSINKNINITGSQVQFASSSGTGILQSATLTGFRTWTLPDATGTIALTNNIWNATGNTGTIAGANFLGTIDTVDLVIKTNNLERIRVANSGSIIINDLAGTGTRTVVADSTGKLSTTISSSGWSTLGNANTSPLTNFIGTTDNVDLVFKRNNIEALRIKDNYIESTKGIFSKGVYPYVGVISSLNTDKYAALGYDDSISSQSAFLEFSRGGISARIFGDNIDSLDKVLQLPNASGTIALTSDITPSTLQAVTSGTNKNLTDGVNLQGTNAGGTPTGTFSDINAFGTNAVNANINASNINAFGAGAAATNNGVSHINAMGVGAAANNANSSYINAFGYSAAYGVTNAGYINALGRNAALNNTGSNVNAMGYQAANGNTANFVNGFGGFAAFGNTGQYVNALGASAAYGNLGSYVNALGYQSAYINSGSNVNAFGYGAGNGNTGGDVNLIGQGAGGDQSGSYVNLFGYAAGSSNSGFHVNALGHSACQNNIGDYVNGIGANAAESNHGIYINAFGWEAAKNNTGNNVNAFGTGAGYGNTISGATIFSNASLPSYANYAAASAAITILAGATSGCTYLYHDQATNSIGAVRL